MSLDLARHVRREGVVPLAWAGTTTPDQLLNLGDALSPVMTALLSGRPVLRAPFRSKAPRLAAVGTIGQNIAGGEVWFWGTGCDPFSHHEGGRRRFTPDPDLRAHVCATRGPVSSVLLGGGAPATAVFGDPVWLLPRFYAPPVEKRWDLGVILHLSELAEKTVDCRPRPELRRYAVGPDHRDRVRLINTVTGRTPADMRARLDEILSCRRILSTSLHGLVFAESYGIPCLYFPTWTGGPGKAPIVEGRGDHRMRDLYAGIGRKQLAFYAQAQQEATDWDAAMAAIDALWTPADFDATPLIEAFPLDLAPLEARPGESIWEHPVLQAFPFAHDAAVIRAEDRAGSGDRAAAGRKAARAMCARLRALGLPALAEAPAPPPPLKLHRRKGRAAASLGLVWAAGSDVAPQVNIGDALSPILVAAISGVPILQAGFESRVERLAAIGTIAHGLRGGAVHIWGSGLDRSINTVDRGRPWEPPPDTAFHVHATRGPCTADVLRRAGIPAPEIFGDPACLIPRVFPLGEVEKRWDLGVIVHLTELDRAPPASTPKSVAERWISRLPSAAQPRPRPAHRRYEVPEAFAGRVRIIHTLVPRSFTGVRAKLREIASCRAILSTSLHGLVLADAYGVPNAWFGFGGAGLRRLDPFNEAHTLDHRMRDLYAGDGATAVPALFSERAQPSDWSDLIALCRDLAPISRDGRALFEAFPGPKAVRWEDPVWPVPKGLVEGFS